jgi:hypothetical protein
LFLDGDAITLSQVVVTPFGPAEISNEESLRGEEETLADHVERLIAPLLGKRKLRKTPVAVCIPASKVYFSTRPVYAATGDSAPHVLLREALQSQNVPVGDMVVDVVTAKSDTRNVASIAACNKSDVSEVLDALSRLDVKPIRTEPAPCALLRLAANRHRAPRNGKVVLRLFLSDKQIFTVLVVNQMPMLWRFTQLKQGEEAMSVAMACRSLVATRKACGVEASLDAVMIHGHTELKRLLDMEWIEEQVAARIKWCDGPAFDRAAIALGAAEGCFERDCEDFDLARSTRPAPKLMQLFPWRDAILETALLACMGLFMGYTYWTLLESQQKLKVSATASGSASSAGRIKLLKQRKELKGQVEALHEYLDSRVVWSSSLRDLTDCIPKNVYLTSIRGLSPLKKMGKKAAKRGGLKKRLILLGEVPLPVDGMTPPEIDELINALRSDKGLKAEFPSVEVEELTHMSAKGDSPPLASFTVKCSASAEKK